MGTLPLAAQAQINSLVNQPYVFFDRSDSTLAMTSAGNPSLGTGQADILDTFPPATFTGGKSNRHDVLLSSNGGVSANTFNIDDSFTFSTLINLSDLSNSPRKEAGIRINSPITGDALFIVNSDAGEIVAFGGGAPFFIFGKNSTGNGYTPGTTIRMGITERGGGDGSGGAANTLEYFIDRDPFNPGGEATSGQLAWSNLELGPLSYNVGVYLQGGAASGSADSMHTVYSNMTYTALATVPEPATCVLSVLGILGLLGVRRRR
jgi:hypothetical protein